MYLSQKSIREFKEIYLNKFGEMISDAEALDRANYLLNAGLAVYGHPLRSPKEEAEAELEANKK